MKHSKKLAALLSVLITISSTNIYSQSEWVLKSTGLNLNALHFNDDMTGWVVGDSGTILATLDGGSNWLCVSSGTSQSLKSVFFINDLTGWAAGDGGVILKSTDGGGNWSSLTSGTTSALSAVFFPTPDTGFVAGPSITRKTTDGGTSWTTIVSVEGSAIYFSSSLVGMVTSSTSFLKRTTTGGISWFSITSEYPSSKNAMSFINSMTGWTAGSGPFIKTTNGGDNWITQPTGASPFITYFGIDFPSASTGYSVGGGLSGGEVLKSTNSGDNWTSVTTGLTNVFRAVQFLDVSTGYIVGDKGSILKTIDGGTNWSKQLIQYSFPFTQTDFFNDIQFKNVATGWIVGFNGVAKTTDGGENWSTLTTASANWEYSVYFPPDNDTGWICGRIGTIQKTENGGTNWTLQTSGTSQHLNCIVVDRYSVGSVKAGWCVGDNGTILSDTLISSWNLQTSGTTNHLNSVIVFDEFNAIVAGNAGTILKTTDAGINWISQVSGTTNDLKAMHFIDANTGYVCGSGGGIRISTDGGSTWSPQSSGTTSQLNSIAFEEIMTSNGFAVGENGTILSTINSGITWLPQASGSTTPLYSVFVKEVPGASGLTSTVIRVVGKLARFAKKIIATALPIELASFTYSLNNNDVTLNWKTVSEINNSGFEIQRKSNTNPGWKKIGFVNGNGTAIEEHEYSYADRNVNSGIYNYRLKQIDYNGNYEYFNLSHEVLIGQPERFELKQNYPNPFNPTTQINYYIPQTRFVSLRIYDVTGKQIQSIVNGITEAGYYSLQFDGSNLSSGIYFYKLSSGDFSAVKKMILVK